MLARGRFVLLATLLLIVTLAVDAGAKAQHDSPYTYEQTFGSTIRLLKVDLDFEIKESNAEWGYLQFIYTSPESGKRKNRGSFTFVKKGDAVGVQLQIPKMPSYHERIIIDKLRRKLSDEHGQPPRRDKNKEEMPRKDDEGDEGDEGAEGDGPQTPKK